MARISDGAICIAGREMSSLQGKLDSFSKNEEMGVQDALQMSLDLMTTMTVVSACTKCVNGETKAMKGAVDGVQP